MLAALRALRQRAKNQGEDRAIAKVMASRPLRKKFEDELVENYGWDGSTLKDLFRIFLENLPEIIALILRLVAK